VRLDNTRYTPADRYGRAKVNLWLSFEQDYVQNTSGSLRYWVMNSKLALRAPDLVARKRSSAIKALEILNAELAHRPFICGNVYGYPHDPRSAGRPSWPEHQRRHPCSGRRRISRYCAAPQRCH
jgi:hypothetical protein